MDDREFFERVKTYLANSKFRIIAMAELAPGAIVVHDNYGEHEGEHDLYFDDNRWEAKSPEIWQTSDHDCLHPPALRGAGIGVLEGIGFGSPPKNFEEFLYYASQVLRAKQKDAWHTAPQSIPVPAELRA